MLFEMNKINFTIDPLLHFLFTAKGSLAHTFQGEWGTFMNKVKGSEIRKGHFSSQTPWK